MLNSVVADKKHQLVQRFTRPGEGVAIGHIRPEMSATGAASQWIAIDLTTAQVPDRRYPAEVGALKLADNMVRLLFGQTKPIGEGLSSLLVIHIPFRGALTFINSMNGVGTTGRTYMKEHNIKDAELLELKNQKEPTQIATVEANIIAAAVAGREACMDFYHSSSFAMHGFGISGKFFAEPIVRVTLTLPLLMAIYDWFVRHKGDMPGDELGVMT